jgi:hypothetical protein
MLPAEEEGKAVHDIWATTQPIEATLEEEALMPWATEATELSQLARQALVVVVVIWMKMIPRCTIARKYHRLIELTPEAK